MKRELDTLLVVVSATAAALIVNSLWAKAQTHAAERIANMPLGVLIPPLF